MYVRISQEMKGKSQIEVGALLSTFLFRKEPFKCVGGVLVDQRLQWGIYESTPLEQGIRRKKYLRFMEISFALKFSSFFWPRKTVLRPAYSFCFFP